MRLLLLIAALTVVNNAMWAKVTLNAQSQQIDEYQEDDSATTNVDSLVFPIADNAYTDNQTPVPQSIDLQNPVNLRDSFIYDPEQNTYFIDRYIGGRKVSPTMYIGADDYRQQRYTKDEQAYFRQRLDALTMFDNKPKLPTMYREGIFDRLFGGSTISIKPQGSLEVTGNGFWENRENFLLPEKQRKYFQPDFNMNMNVNLVAQIGEKLKLNLSNNTSPSLLNQNLQKIELTGKEDEIIKKIELGNVNFPLRSGLIQGVQSLFGVKTQLQFGKLWVTSALSQQKSQRKSLVLQGGAQNTQFDLKADEYEENKNFLLAQYFKNNYDKALERFPVINSQVQITKIEVWVTNRTGAVNGVRDVIAFMDLGESQPFVPTLTGGNSTVLPDNRSNKLYDILLQEPASRKQATASQYISSQGLTEGQDFQRVTMRILNQTEFDFQPQLGYITLNAQVYPDDVLAVSYRYTYNGEVYQVGEFSDEMPPDTANQRVLFAKLLKSTANRPQLPLWDLMMKNIYNMGAQNVSNENFNLNVFYQDPGGGEKRYLTEGVQAGVPIIRVLNLDKLNKQGDPISDGVFDFVEGVTINTRMGKIIFPVLEPFSDGLKEALDNDPSLEAKYLFKELYDSTRVIAQQQQQKNRFIIKGSYQSASGSDIFLGGFSIPEGSVTVSAGGTLLQEGTDYQVDYSMGRLKILNQGILNSGLPLNIQFEDNGAFGFLQQNFIGTRLDYFANDNLTIGATYMKLSERPFSYKSKVGDDPISNTVLGADVAYQSEAPWLTRALDKLPFYSTNAPSLIAATVEGAALIPGHHKFSNLDGEGTQYIDDFEGSAGMVDLKFPVHSWSLSSVPKGAVNTNGTVLFPESQYTNDLRSGSNRANLTWYTIEPNLLYGNIPESIKQDTALMNYWRQVSYTDIFPQKSNVAVQNQLTTFDLSYYPSERGPYNFDTDNIDPYTGELLNPKDRWGGIQRAIDNLNSDFEASNVEYITFWMLDPYIYNPNAEGGELYFNLGNISEDVLKDGRMGFENGIENPKDLTKLEATPFGYVPKFQQQITRAFLNDQAARELQDVGFDLLDDEEEKVFFSSYLQDLQAAMTPGSPYLEKYLNDPSTDNYKHFRNPDYDTEEATLLNRYRKFNHPHGNTPVNQNIGGNIPGTALPDSEDINRDNTLNETESYFQYRIPIKPDMQVGEGFIVDKQEPTVKLKNGRMSKETWYQYKIPIRSYDRAVGGIADFRSIRFIRMFLTGFQDSLTLRFGQLQLDRNNWRRYMFSLVNPGENIPEDNLASTKFAVTTVGLEQNNNKEPVPYVMPPGIIRQEQPISSGQNVQLDEQSISVQVCGLVDGDSRGIFKDMGGLDLRQYDKLRMFVHAENVPGEIEVQKGDVFAFIRLGTDFTHNYYEYRIPVVTSPNGTRNAEQVWPLENRMILDMKALIGMKNERNAQGKPAFIPYKKVEPSGNELVVVGNPNVAETKNIMLGISNPKKTLLNPNDDGLKKCVEVWFNELRATGMNEEVGYAASASLNVQLADLGSAQFGGSMHTTGYGNINQKLNERFRDNFQQFNATTNLNLGKLFPTQWGLTLPVFFGYSENVSNPQFDPYDKDVLLKDKLARSQDKDAVRKAAQDFNSVTSFNVNNIRLTGNPSKRPKFLMPWSPKNFDLNYSFNRQLKRNPLIEKDELLDQKLSLGYSYKVPSLRVSPFRKLIKDRSSIWNLIKDINFNLLPNTISLRNDLRKVFGETIVRNIDDGQYKLPALYFQNFTWDRNFIVGWELAKSLNLNYRGTNSSRIDEPYGRLDTREKRDTLMSNLIKLGRNTHYTHDISATYSLPFKRVKALNWISANATYNASYFWTGASRLAQEQGNTISNKQTKQLNGQINFDQLYKKSRWVKAAYQKNSGRSQSFRKSDMSRGVDRGALKSASKTALKQTTGKDANKKRKRVSQKIPPKPERNIITVDSVKGADRMTPGEVRTKLRQLKKAERRRFRKAMIAWRRKKQNIIPDVSEGYKVGVRLATMLKNVNFNYTESQGTLLPGYMDSVRILGMNSQSFAPGLFAFGLQPTQQWLLEEAAKGRLTRDSVFNTKMQQQYSQEYKVSANIEPFDDLRIELDLRSSFRKNFNSIFKFDNATNEFRNMNPYDMGSFKISYMGISSMFEALPKDKVSATFINMLNYRPIVSRRLGAINPYTNGLLDPADPEYAKGYGRYSHDVVIPAFIAAYSGKSAEEAPLLWYENRTSGSNPFRNFIPMPNWNITYTGLTKVGNLDEYIKSFTASHTYSGDLSMNSFNSNLMFRDVLSVGFPSFIDSVSGSYIPYFMVPNITINKSFGPLLGLDMIMHNTLNLRVMLNKSRMTSLNLNDYQVSEMNSSEIIIGAGYRLKGMNLPFSIFGLTRLENDINIKADFGYRDDISVNSYMSTKTAIATTGQKVITISPSIDYIINEKLQLRLFFDRRQSIPYIQNSFPITTTRAGLTVRYIFADGM